MPPASLLRPPMAMATTTTSNNSIAEPVERDWHSLNPDIQQRILLQLPISAAVKLASVCKQWLAIFSSPSFAQLSRIPTGKQPWFFLWGINELIHTRSAAFAFDPQVGRWFRLQTARPPDFNRASLSGTSGLFFAFSGSKVCFTPTPIKMKWKETSPAISTRCSALMGTFGSPLSSSFKFVTVGGVFDGGDDHMVEMYDASTNTWESCDPLPVDGFHDILISSHWMSSAVLGHKFYVADYYGGIATFDIHTKSWSKVESLRVPDLEFIFIIAADEGLYAIGVCCGQIGAYLKLFKVDEVTMACKEVSEMPHDLFSQFENEQKEASLRCVGSGNLIYVYSELNYKGYPVCMCDLSEASYEWKQLPSLPSPPRFNRVVYCSATVTPRACLQAM